MKVTIDMTRGDEGERAVVETPALIFATDRTTYWLDNDAFTADTISEMSMRDRALLEAFVLLSCRKLGWEVNDVTIGGDDQ